MNRNIFRFLVAFGIFILYIAVLGTWALSQSAQAQNISAVNVTPIPTPTSKIGSLDAFVNLLITIMMYIAMPGIVLALVWAGFLFVTARGDEKQLETAKRVFVWTVVGATIIIGARVIYEVAKGTVDPFVTIVSP